MARQTLIKAMVTSLVFCFGQIQQGLASTELPVLTKEGQDYKSEISSRIARNFTATANLARTIKIFVLPDGFVRNASLEAPPKSSFDCALLDAAYSASPLPTPPLFRAPLPAPTLPQSTLPLKPSPSANQANDPTNYLGSGWYTISIKDLELAETSEKSPKSDEYALHLIPFEVLYRYPEILTPAELESPSNIIRINPSKLDMTKLEFLRNQWATFYRDHPKSNKDEILNWSLTIVKPIAMHMHQSKI